MIFDKKKSQSGMYADINKNKSVALKMKDNALV